MHHPKIAVATNTRAVRWTSIGTRIVVYCVLLGFGRAPSAAAAQMVHARAQRSLTLQQLILEVAAGNPGVLASEAHVRAARGARSTASAFRNPMFSYQVENAPLPGRPAPLMDREAMAMATLPLQPLYGRWSRVREANAELEAAESNAFGNRQQIMLEAARAFYAAALAQVELDGAIDLNAWMDSVVAYNRSRADEGAIAELDLIRSQLERDRVAAEHSMHAADYVRARGQLSAFLADTATVAVRFDTVPMHAASPGDILAAVKLTHVLDNRWDLRAARARVTAARAAVGVERSMIISDLDATLGIKRSAGMSSLIFGISAPLPLLNQNRGATRRASAERDAAGYDLITVQRVARGDIVGHAQAEELLTTRAAELSSGFLRRADEARDITLAAYREGGVPLLQVMDAARAWSEARTTFFHLLFQQHLSVLERVVSQGVDLVTVELRSEQ